MKHRTRLHISAAAGTMVLTSLAAAQSTPAASPLQSPSRLDETSRARYHTVAVQGVDVFYREAGPKDAPTILLLHGFPSSSSMFRNLIPALADRYHLVAPDYPGFGQSAQPAPDQYTYTFDNLAQTVDTFTQQLGLTKFAIYVQDYGAPVGYRLAVKHPERITGIIVQNGNAYDEGLPDAFWGPLKEYWKNPTPELRTKLEGFLGLETTKWQYLHGARDPQNISPDAYLADQRTLDRPGNKEVQIALFKDYGSNPPLYPSWQEYFRTMQPPMLIVWGKNDQIFPPAGAEPYKRDLKNLDFNLLDTGHFALEEDGDLIASKIRAFMDKNVPRRRAVAPPPPDGFDRFVISKSPGFTDAGFYRAFTKAAPVETVVIYCLDPRSARVPELVADALPGQVYPGVIRKNDKGEKIGSTTTIVPIVTAGGRAVDAVRSISALYYLFGIKSVVVVHHTFCGQSSYTADGFYSKMKNDLGVDLKSAVPVRDVCISALETSLRDDVTLLRDAPGIPKSVNIYGYVYDIDAETLTLMVKDTGK
jgi:pimeloyl-ACP methyl ester carboxylesterase/carbonic anhydrase